MSKRTRPASKPASRKVTFRRRVVLALIVSVVAVVGYAVYTLKVDEIRVTGLRTLDAAAVVKAAELRGGERILWIRLSSIERRVESIPAVASATADRSFPGAIVIRVTERSPVARLAGTRPLAVDEHGRMFASPLAGVVPELEGWRGSADPGASVDDATTRVVGAFVRFPPVLREQTVRITIGPPLVLVLRSGTQVRFGTHDDLAHKAAVAVAVLAAEHGRELDYVDVRAPNVPAAKEKDPPTPAPTPVRTAAPAATTPRPAPSPPPTASPDASPVAP